MEDDDAPLQLGEGSVAEGVSQEMDSRERLLSRQEEARPVPVQRPERPAEEGARNEVPRPQSHPDREKREAEVNYVSQHLF